MKPMILITRAKGPMTTKNVKNPDPRLPITHRVGLAPDWGYYIYTPATLPILGNKRLTEFHRTQEAAVKAYNVNYVSKEIK